MSICANQSLINRQPKRCEMRIHLQQSQLMLRRLLRTHISHYRISHHLPSKSRGGQQTPLIKSRDKGDNNIEVEMSYGMGGIDSQSNQGRPTGGYGMGGIDACVPAWALPLTRPRDVARHGRLPRRCRLLRCCPATSVRVRADPCAGVPPWTLSHLQGSRARGLAVRRRQGPRRRPVRRWGRR
jgi:hypothetical protein